MRNLNLRRAIVHQSDIFSDCEAFQEDCENGLIYVATPKSVFVFNTSDNEVSKLLDWETERAGSKLLDFQIFFDSFNELCAVFSSGSIVLIDVDAKTLEETAFVGFTCDAASWSASLSTLAVSDGQVIILYDRGFEVVAENNIWTGERGKDELVSVGWGSKETQFQGSAGKLSARKKVETVVERLVKDSGKTHIHWRADDKYVSVSAFNETNDNRSIMIFDMECKLISRMKNDKPMEECFAVRPVGNYIATIAPHSEFSREIRFFEKNGELRHSYVFPCVGSSPCLGMKWNSDATILAIVYRQAHKDIVELWTISNYDWTRKWSFATEHKILSWDWNIERPRKLVFATELGEMFSLEFEFEYTIGESMAIVLASQELRVTNLAKHPIPPPMCQFSLALDETPTAYCSDRERVTLIYSDGKIETRLLTPNSDADISAKVTRSFKTISSIAYAGSSTVLAVIDGNKIFEIDLASGGVIEVHSHPGPVIWLGFISDSIYFADESGHYYKNDGPLAEKVFSVNTMSAEEQSFHSAVENGNIFTLASSHELFKNGRSVADSVSSFAVGRNFCLFTTLQNKLLIYNADEWIRLAEPRGLEIGSRLVDIAKEGTAVTMQMPRGNLETIHPRPFVVETLRKLIDELKYVEAMRLMKKHRIDMNLLCDHNPEIFVGNIQKLLNGLDADLVNLFIASLNQERSEFCTADVLPEKVTFITNKLCEYVLALNVAERIKMFTVLLSSLLKSSPPKTEDALKYIKELTDEMNTIDKDFHSRKWLHHVSFFVNDSSMFNAALATYDLSLTVQVAEASNRDPKEYLPLLNELRKLQPEEYRRYRIDLLREDWKSALSNISKLDDRFEEAVNLIKSKGIYSDALEIFLYDEEKFKKIAKLCATHYESKASFNEALIFFEKAEDYDNAMRAAISVGSLPALQRVSKKAGLSVEDEKNHLKKLVLMLKQKSRFADAAVVYELLGNHNDAVAMHIAAGHWNYASNVDYFEEVADIVHQESLNQVEIIVREIMAYENDFTKYVKRLEVVRDIKEKLLQNLKDGIETGRDLEDCDAFSEAASTLSMISRRTGKTTSSRASTTATVRKRKQIDRKKQSLKEGGEYEDSALLLTLKKHYAWANKTAVVVKSLSVCLLRCLQIREAKLLQEKFSKFRSLLQTQKHHIWPNRWEPKHLAGPVYALYSVDNVFSFPSEGGMPNSIVLEPELVAPELVDEEAFKINL